MRVLKDFSSFLSQREAIKRSGGLGMCMLVEIGPEGWTPTQQPLESFPSLRLLYEATSTTKARKGNAKHPTTQ
jgi:hypothetical protein